MKLITSPEVTIPRSFFVPASVTGSRRNPHSVIVATALIMFCVGGTEITSRVAIAITSPSCCTMWDLNSTGPRSNFPCIFKSRSPCLVARPFWFVNVPPFFSLSSGPVPQPLPVRVLYPDRLFFCCSFPARLIPGVFVQMVSCASCRFGFLNCPFVACRSRQCSPVWAARVLCEPGKDVVPVEDPHKGNAINDRKPAHIVIDHEPGRIGKRCPAGDCHDLLCHHIPDGLCTALGHR